MTAGPGDPPPPPDADGEAPEPVFATVEEWMDGYFLPVFQRPVGGEYRWCPQWHAHPEAVTRLTAMWRSWEALRLEPATGISDWLRDHADYHLAVLLDRRGPFYQCDPDSGHMEGRPLPVAPAAYRQAAP